MPLSTVSNQQPPLQKVPHLIGSGGTGPGGGSAADACAFQREWQRTSASADCLRHPYPAAAQWIKPAATGLAHASAAHLRFQDRKRKSHAYSLIPAAFGQGPGGARARLAEWRQAHATG